MRNILASTPPLLGGSVEYRIRERSRENSKRSGRGIAARGGEIITDGVVCASNVFYPASYAVSIEKDIMSKSLKNQGYRNPEDQNTERLMRGVDERTK